MNTHSSPAIFLHNVSKTYPGSSVAALKDINLRVMPGEVYGFLGPNGAGKSTTIRILMNFIKANTGLVEIMGKNVSTDSLSIHAETGYLTGDYALYPKMTGKQILTYLAELQGMSSIKPALDLASRLTADLDKQSGDLSRGNKQKLAIIQAFMHQPRIYILDEPTSGLDPLAQEIFYDLIKEAKARGAAVFMSSHNLSEVQKICDRVGIIRSGSLISEDSISNLALQAAQTFEITFKDSPPLTLLKKITDSIENTTKHSVLVHISGDMRPLFRLLSKHEITKLEARSLDLEEQFLKLYSGEES